ncbi:MAG: MFS transporter [Burkholderiaceae bacterium]
MSDARQARSVLAWLAVANFASGLVAFVVIGLIELLARDFGLSTASTGWVVSIYAIAYAIGSPVLVALTGRWARRSVLATGMCLLIVSALICALAPSFEILLAARIVSALGAGLITPVTSGVAFAVAAPGQQGRAMSAVFFGLTLAQALGIPAGSFIGFQYGWRVAFWLVLAVGLVALAGLWWRIPRTLAVRVNSLRTLGQALASPARMASILFTAVFLGAIYIIHTYFAPLLMGRMGFGRDGVSLGLLALGLGAITGNLVGGWLSDRFGPLRTLTIIGVAQILATPMFSFLPLPAVLVLPWAFLFSALGWAFAVPQQARIVAQAPEAASVTLALNAAAIYLGVAGGAAIGGLVLAHTGLDALGWAAAATMVLAVVHLHLSERMALRAARLPP